MATAIPTYAELLNRIAAGEALGERALHAWAKKTKNPDFAKVLTTIAIREGEHSKAFEKRLCELGCSVDWSNALGGGPEAEQYLAYLESDASDLEKLERAFALTDGTDPFKGFFDDDTIDPITGGLLGRYIAEERDSGRMLRACFEELKAGAGANGSAQAVSLQDVCAAVTSLTGVVNELKSEIASMRASA